MIFNLETNRKYILSVGKNSFLLPRSCYPVTKLLTKLDLDLFAMSFKELYQYSGEYGDLKLKSFEGSPLKTNFPSQIIGLFCDPAMLGF